MTTSENMSTKQERYHAFLHSMHDHFGVSHEDMVCLPDRDLYAVIGQKLMEYAISHPKEWNVFEQQLRK
jgi:hypothetical protein